MNRITAITTLAIAATTAAEPFAIFEPPVTVPPPPVALVPGNTISSGGMDFMIEPGPFGPAVSDMSTTFSFNGTNVVSLNNNTLRVTAPLPADLIRFEFRWQGGDWSIEVNGDRISGNTPLRTVIGAGAVVGGTEVSVFSVLSPATGSETGYVRIRGPINDLSVFGQEFQVDDFQVPCPPRQDPRPTADINGDDVWNVFDILAFFDLFSQQL